MSKCSVYCGPPQPLDVGFHCSETSPQPSLCLALASSHMVKIHCPLKPAGVPSSVPGRALSVCMAGFPSEVLCTAPSLAYLMGNPYAMLPLKPKFLLLIGKVMFASSKPVDVYPCDSLENATLSSKMESHLPYVANQRCHAHGRV